MTRTRRHRWAAALIIAGLALAPASDTALAAPSASPTSSAEATTFTVGILQDIDSLNPFVGIVAEAYEMYGLMYDQLLGYSQKDFSPVPGLAESWTESTDRKSWTYKIRSGVTWSDGTPLTAKDAAYTFTRIINGEFEQTNYGSYVANITAAAAPDDTTLVLSVKQPTPIMLRLAVPILPEHVWKEIDAKEVATYANEPPQGGIGSGPFVLTERRTGQFIRFTANKDYWAGAPKVSQVVFRIFANEDAAVQALKKGEIDFLDGLSPSPFNAIKGEPGITAVAADYSGFNELAFNVGAATADGKPIGDGHPAFKDKKVRQAIAYAIDKKTLVDKVLGGLGSEGNSVIPPLYPSDHWQPELPYTFDLAKANQLLEDAGYQKGADGIRTMPDGSKPLKGLRLFARQESTTSQQSAQFIQSWLKQVGIDTRVEVVEENKLTEIIGQGEFDMFEWGWVVEPDPDYQMSTFTCAKRSYEDAGVITADLSDSFYCNPAFDALYAQQGSETDLGKRSAIVKQMQQILYDDAPYVVTFYYDELQAYRSDRFTDLKPQPDPGGVLLFQYGTFTYRSVRPASGDGGGSSSGAPWGLVAGIGAGLLAVAGAGVAVARSRRRATADDRE